MTNDVSDRWRSAGTVSGFASAPPNPKLVAWARGFVADGGCPLVLDIGCGAARNSIPLATLGCRVVGLDLSEPMLIAAADRARREHAPDAPPIHLRLVRGPMAPLPFRDGAFDIVVAHGVWNLARSDDEFRAALAEAARVCRIGGGLFLFTFSRGTLPAAAEPAPGQRFTFTQFAGEPQVFLTEADILDEFARAGFVRDVPGPLTRYNARSPLSTTAKGPPELWEGTFRRE